jgi:hypothetical protein
MAQTVRGFVEDAYQLISASTPTVPLQGNDLSKGIQFLNELIKYYSATALMTTIAREITFSLPIGQEVVTFGSADDVPTPDVTQGRLANLQNAWLELDGVTYPLIDESRNVFFQSYKYDPQVGLPRFIVIVNDTAVTRMRFYPAASQIYQVHVFGKFQLSSVTANDTMAFLPAYYQRYFKFAVAKDLSFYKGRSLAWTKNLEDEYREAKKEMEAVSPVNLTIQTEQESYLNGAWRIRAGI